MNCKKKTVINCKNIYRYQIAKATECNDIDINENELFRQCVIMHNKAYKLVK